MSKVDWVKYFIDIVFTPGAEKVESDIIAEKMNYIKMPLYKYCSVCEESSRTPETVDYTITNFENDDIFFQTPDKLNDPFDCYLGFTHRQMLISSIIYLLKQMNYQEYEMYEIILDLMSNLDKDSNLSPTLQSLKKKILDQIAMAQRDFKIITDKSYRITCFSESKDSQLMWSHYANKHYGFCLEYDFSDSLGDMSFELKLALTMLFPVIYTTERPSLSEALLSHYIKSISGKNQEADIDFTKDMILGLLFKSSEWSYEKEWRIIKMVGDTPTMHLPKAKKVFLGMNIENTAKNKILEIATRKNVPVYQMAIKPDKYELDFAKVEV